MVNPLPAILRRKFGVSFLLIAVGLFLAPAVRAGLTIQLDLIYNESAGVFTCQPTLATNGNGPDLTPVTYHQIRSPDGSFIGDFPGNSFDLRNTFSDINSFLQELTNGNWQLILNVGATNQQTCTFTVSTSGLTTNSFGSVGVDFPVNGSTITSTLPDFAWHGPASWDQVLIELYNSSFSVFQYSYDSAATTNSTLPPAVPSDTYTFGIDYSVAANSTVVASTPLNSSNQPLAGWISTGQLDHGNGISFTVSAPALAYVGSHKLIAWYPFDTNYLAQDVSGNGNDINSTGNFGGPAPSSTTTNIAGGGAAALDGDNWFILPDVLTGTIAGSYSISLWLDITGTYGNNSDQGYQDLGIVYADISGVANDSIPMSETGSKLGFFTGNPDVTLNSSASINSGPNNFTHIVVTRDQSSGTKTIYINGVLDSTGTGSTNLLNDSTQVLLGMNGGNGVGVNGFIDDAQFYSGVLSPAEVAFLHNNPGQSVPNVTIINGNLVAHYAFDDSNNLGADSSGNGFDLDYNGQPQGNGVTFDSNAQAGSGAAYFDGGSFLSYNHTPTNVLAALASNLTVSLWINTTQTYGNDGDIGWAGAGIIAADVPASVDDIVPMALNGGDIGFNTGPDDDTIHSTVDINDGNYHHIVITRDQSTGEKQIYVDGAFNTSDSASTDLLNAPVIMAVGAAIDASNPNPSSANTGQYFQGDLDDIQIYNRVLSSTEITYLYDNPGQTLAGGEPDFNAALNTTNLNWSTSGDTSWFVETTNTYDGVSAAQSGPVTGSQTSVLTLNVTGPGTISFYWKYNVSGNFDTYFDIDGNNYDDVSGYYNWQLDTYYVPAGQHTLTWTATANGDNDPTEATFLDEVSYVQITPPVITVNPFDQTNYPGYPVALIAAVSNTNDTTLTWQWYKVGTGAIANATNSFFSPTNSGTASVAGNYYAIASNSSGSAGTTTNTVTFISAPLPPDWSIAFKSAFQEQDTTQIFQDYYYGMLVDASGNLYAAGEFGGNDTFGPSTLNSGSGGDAAALVKQSPTGAGLWAVGITNNGLGNSFAECVALAPAGGVYVSGNYSGTNYLGTNQLQVFANGGFFVARFDTNGSNIWIKTFGNTNDSFIIENSLMSDTAGNVIVAALFGVGTVTLGSNTFYLTNQTSIIFELDVNGNVIWADRTPGEFVQHIAYSGGQVYASFSTVVSGTQTNALISNTFLSTDRAWALASINDSNGQVSWLIGLGAVNGGRNNNPYSTSIIDDVPRVAVYGTNVFVLGVAYGSSATFGPLTVNFNSLREEYFARYDTNGVAQTATNFGGVTTTTIAVVPDGKGNVYVDGLFDTSSEFGNYLIAAPREELDYTGDFSQAFLAKFDVNGNALWARMATSSAYVNLLGIALASDGVWASGFGDVSFSFGKITFGTNTFFSDIQYAVGGEGSGELAIPHSSGLFAKITDATSSSPTPVTLVSDGVSGGNYQFTFISTAGYTNQVQFTTNLTTHSWTFYTNIIGDGTLKSIIVPANTPAEKFFRVTTQ